MTISSRLAPLIALSTTRIKEFFREPGAVFWTFGFPLLITVALGVAFRNEGPPRAGSPWSSTRRRRRQSW